MSEFTHFFPIWNLMTDKHYIPIVNLISSTIYHSSNLTQSCFNLFVYRTFNKNLSIDDIKKYFKEDHFTFLVVEANELHFGFDLSKAAEFSLVLALMVKILMASLLVGNLHDYYLHGRWNEIAGINL